MSIALRGCAFWRRGEHGKTYDLERVGDDSDGHELLAVVSAVHHHGVGETLNDGALGLAESLGGITASRVANETLCQSMLLCVRTR